jgi:hypothetical protein
MQLLQKLLNKFTGLHYKQDYVCLSKESFQQSLHAYIVSGNKVIKNITDNYLFTGYCPLVFSFPAFNEINLSKAEKIEIVFAHHEFFPNDLIEKRDAIAKISLKKIHQQTSGEYIIYYYEGQKGEHQFISSFHQLVIQLRNKFYNKKPGNVYLRANLLKQVQIAYAVPRIISLITVNDGNLYNLFPTDLHGQIDDDNYIISLRHGGMASKQVEMTKRILVTEIDSAFYKTVYSLGKNHMQELKVRDNFPFSDQMSATFHLPLPQCAINYRELTLKEYFDHGIHRFFLFKILNKRQIESEPSTLAHIHNVFATWRHNKGVPGNYLLR